MVQQGIPHLPFGGRGTSGLGHYGGRYKPDPVPAYTPLTAYTPLKANVHTLSYTHLERHTRHTFSLTLTPDTLDRYSFETFSQKRTILYKHGNRNHPLVDMWIRYPPGDTVKVYVYTLCFRILLSYTLTAFVYYLLSYSCLWLPPVPPRWYAV